MRRTIQQHVNVWLTWSSCFASLSHFSAEKSPTDPEEKVQKRAKTDGKPPLVLLQTCRTPPVKSVGAEPRSRRRCQALQSLRQTFIESSTPKVWPLHSHQISTFRNFQQPTFGKSSNFIQLHQLMKITTQKLIPAQVI